MYIRLIKKLFFIFLVFHLVTRRTVFKSIYNLLL